MKIASLANTIRLCVAVLALAAAATVVAQPAGQSNPTPTPTPQASPFPRVRLTHYPGVEGNVRKEILIVDLTEWTPELDVYLDYVWEKRDPAAWSPSPDTDARFAPGFKFAPPPRRIWNVRYVPSATAGESNLFVQGVGRTGRVRIYTASDYIRFLHFPNVGWRELGAEARIYNYLQTGVSTQPFPTRSQ
jgi:hypothetical protein